MKFSIKHQASYSRGELLLRAFFGIIYIGLPHGIVLMILALPLIIIMPFLFLIILITGKYPRGIFNYMLNLMNWGQRLNASLRNMADGYPAFGLDTRVSHVVLEVPYPESVNRGLVLARVFFGMIYVIIPHGICLMFLGLGAGIGSFIAFWAILITGKYPKGIFDFVVGVNRWGLRVNLYMSYLTDTYPPFSMEETNPVNWNEDKKIEDHLV
jgi:hypothetical protein